MFYYDFCSHQAPQTVGTFFTIPVRVNTGPHTLGAFLIVLTFDSSDLIVNDSTTFPIRGGSVNAVASINASYVQLTGTILNSRVQGTADEQSTKMLLLRCWCEL